MWLFVKNCHCHGNRSRRTTFFFEDFMTDYLFLLFFSFFLVQALCFLKGELKIMYNPLEDKGKCSLVGISQTQWGDFYKIIVTRKKSYNKGVKEKRDCSSESSQDIAQRNRTWWRCWVQGSAKRYSEGLWGVCCISESLWAGWNSGLPAQTQWTRRNQFTNPFLLAFYLCFLYLKS